MKSLDDELDEILEHSYNAGYSVKDAAKQRLRSLILRERLNEAEAMWEMFDGYYADASDLCDYAPDRIKALKAEMKREEE